MIAAGLLAKAGESLHLDSRAGGLREAIAQVIDRVEHVEDSDRGVADTVFVACEMVHLCEALAGRSRHSSPAAIGCAKLADAAAQLALEALTERGVKGVEALSRRGRQLVEIQDLRAHLDEAVDALELHSSTLMPLGRSLREDLRAMIDGSDPEHHLPETIDFTPREG